MKQKIIAIIITVLIVIVIVSDPWFSTTVVGMILFGMLLFSCCLGWFLAGVDHCAKRDADWLEDLE